MGILGLASETVTMHFIHGGIGELHQRQQRHSLRSCGNTEVHGRLGGSGTICISLEGTELRETPPEQKDDLWGDLPA